MGEANKRIDHTSINPTVDGLLQIMISTRITTLAKSTRTTATPAGLGYDEFNTRTSKSVGSDPTLPNTHVRANGNGAGMLIVPLNYTGNNKDGTWRTTHFRLWVQMHTGPKAGQSFNLDFPATIEGARALLAQLRAADARVVAGTNAIHYGSPELIAANLLPSVLAIGAGLTPETRVRGVTNRNSGTRTAVASLADAFGTPAPVKAPRAPRKIKTPAIVTAPPTLPTSVPEPAEVV